MACLAFLQCLFVLCGRSFVNASSLWSGLVYTVVNGQNHIIWTLYKATERNVDDTSAACSCMSIIVAPHSRSESGDTAAIDVAGVTLTSLITLVAHVAWEWVVRESARSKFESVRGFREIAASHAVEA
ncbi:hypothetical protein GWI33_020407 [Rhynchophorus ferrugineus]|uniref:Uncharacterized protein n=1 Tax=Rhynchophorus ferrugineus TaxID=354439 RepID=A0A834M3D9_RHYFE|nr:hypothetical protein GWI33_020407 [Rhynchophorus ferrugineus]